MSKNRPPESGGVDRDSSPKGWRESQKDFLAAQNPVRSVLKDIFRAFCGHAGGSAETGFVSNEIETTRRGLLRLFVGAAGMGAVAGVVGNGIKNRLDRNDQIEAAAKMFCDWQFEGQVEALQAGEILPEDERKAEVVMLALNPEYSSIPIVGGFDFGGEIERSIQPMLRDFTPGTEVILIVPLGTSSEVLEKIGNYLPGLNFKTVELPMPDSEIYAQDIMVATGSRDSKGRIKTVGNSRDQNLFEVLRQLKTYPNKDKLDNMSFAGLSGISKYKRECSEHEEAALDGVKLFGDEIIARENPDLFKVNYVPLSCEGGDLRPTRLPNGKLGLIISRSSLIKTLVADYTDELNGNLFVYAQRFLEIYEEIKLAYKRCFGVEEVIILDEEKILKDVKIYAQAGVMLDINKLLKQTNFFHTDMIVNTATNPRGEKVAFVSSVNPQNIESTLHTHPDADCLNRVAEDFESRGYKVVRLECGEAPVLNYTGSVMYTNAQGEKVVHVPQYGILEDYVAVLKYEKEGFKVVKVDMAYLKDASDEEKMTAGSLHCKLSVMV